MEQKPQGAEYLCERAKEDAFIPIFFSGKINQKPLVSPLYFFSFSPGTNIILLF